MNVVHHFGILHNDLSKDNIMLHFLLDKPNVVYIGVYNWGEIKRLQEVTPSFYGFAKEQDATNAKKVCWWVAQELFFGYNESGITNSFDKWPSNTKQLDECYWR
jgi:hypothetical protein